MSAARDVINEAVSKTLESGGTGPKEKTRPRVLQLTKEERLEAENIQLKKALLKASITEQTNRLFESEKVLAASMSARLGVDIRSYTVDIDAGVCVLRDEQAGQPPTAKAD